MDDTLDAWRPLGIVADRLTDDERALLIGVVEMDRWQGTLDWLRDR